MALPDDYPQTEAPPAGPWAIGFLRRAIPILLGLALLAALGYYCGFRESLDQLGRLSPVALIPLTAAYSVAWLLRAQRLRQLVRLMHGRIQLHESLAIELAGDLANYVVPAKLGDVAKIVWLKSRGNLGYGPGFVAVFLVRATDLALVLVMGLAAMLCVSPTEFPHYQLIVATLAALVVAMAAGAAVLFIRPSVFVRLLIGPLRPLAALVKAFHAAVTGNIGGFLRVLATTSLIWLFEILTLVTLLHALGVELAFPQASAALLMANLSKALPITPNGLGVFESALAVMLQGFQVARSTSFAVGLLFSAFVNAYTLLLGIPAVLLYRVDFRGLRRSGANERIRAEALDGL